MLTTHYVTGSPNWLDLGTHDIDGAAEFYRAVLGWTFEPGGPEVGGYGRFQADGKTVAGGMSVPAEQGAPSWNIYFQTPDADLTAKTVEQAGGTVTFQPMDVMELGRSAYFRDPTGVAFSAWQPGLMPGMEVVNDFNTLSWVELWTPNVDAAKAFYHTVFGLNTAEVPFPGGVYSAISPADGGPDSMCGGIVPLDTDSLEVQSGPYWLPYIEVEHVDATAAAIDKAGGAIRMAPADIEGVGRFAKVADPYGARFAIIKSAPAA